MVMLLLSTVGFMVLAFIVGLFDETGAIICAFFSCASAFYTVLYAVFCVMGAIHGVFV